MVKRKLAALEKVDADLANLQNKIKRDPSSYENDFLHQYMQYENQRIIFLQAPASTSENALISFRDLIEFVAHVSDCYKAHTQAFPGQLIEILSAHHATLEPQLREKIVGSLVLLRKKEIIDSTVLQQCFFPILTSTPSKTLRALLLQKILSDLRSANSKATNHKLNRTVQNDLHNLVCQDRSSSKALWAVKITREMWKRQIWTDAKAVDIMKECALAENDKVIVGGARFFLGGDKEREEAEDESSDDEGIDMGQLRHRLGVNKTKKAARKLEAAAATVKRKEKKKRQPHPLNFSALHLLHDPQSFAEAMFSRHLQNPRSRLNLEQKLLVLQLVSRLIGLHKLTVISFYSYFLKYLTPRQPSVTSFLASLAQSTHNLVPPDILEPLIQKIANEFVSEAAAGEVAAAGLNAIREICARQPLAMNETLLQDLVQYRKSKDKGVMMASKGLLSLYREVGAEMLRKRDRGKDATIDLKSGERKQQRYGEEIIGEIEGLDLLEKWKEEEKQRKRDEGEDSESDEEQAWAAWNVEDEDSDDSGGWINVESDDEINISDSDDEKQNPSAKKVKFDVPNDDKENPPKPEDATDLLATTSSNLATTRILTPADLAKLQELRTTASVSSLVNKNHKTHHQPKQASSNSARHADDPLTSAEIEGLASLSRGKATRAEKIALLEQQRAENGEEHKSKAAKKKERKREEGKSSTNKEKERKKNFLMTLGKARRKGKRSLVEQRKVLKMNEKRQKGKKAR
jgi:protein SDA1